MLSQTNNKSTWAVSKYRGVDSPLACLPVGEAIITLACNKQYYSSLPWVIFVERGKKSHTIFIILFPSTFSSSFSCKKGKRNHTVFIFIFPSTSSSSWCNKEKNHTVFVYPSFPFYFLLFVFVQLGKISYVYYQLSVDRYLLIFPLHHSQINK